MKPKVPLIPFALGKTRYWAVAEYQDQKNEKPYAGSFVHCSFYKLSFTHLTPNAFCLDDGYIDTLGLKIFNPLAIARSVPEEDEVQYIDPASSPEVNANILFRSKNPC